MAGSLGTSALATVGTSSGNVPANPLAYASLSGKPTLGQQVTVDTGWTANNTAGDKTSALSSYENGLNATIISALNLAAANSGTALGAALDVLVIVVKKLAALETALAASKLPNA